MALHILKTTIQYCCVLKPEENKKVVCFLSFRDDDSISLSEVTAHCVCSIYTTNFYHLKRKGSPFFQHKNSSPIFINFDRM